MIVGNKTDLERKLPFEEIEGTVCLDWECGYAEASAYTGQGVGQVFKELLRQVSSDDFLPCSAPTGGHLEKKHSLARRLFSRENNKEGGDS